MLSGTDKERYAQVPTSSLGTKLTCLDFVEDSSRGGAIFGPRLKYLNFDHPLL